MSEEEYKKAFSNNLRAYTEANGKTQADLVKDLGFNKSTVSTWFNGIKIPRMDKIDALCNYFGISRSDLIEDKSNKTIELNKKDERDIAKRLEQTLDQLESDQDGLMFSGEPLDDQTRELLKASIQNSITIAKINAKQKFTPKKYRDKK